MATTAEASGTQTATVGTEHFIRDVAQAGVFTLHVDTNAMLDGDVLELRVYQMVLTAGTSRVAQFVAYYGAQPAHDLIKFSVPLGNELTDATSLRYSLKQTFGTGRAFPWKVLRYA